MILLLRILLIPFSFFFYIITFIRNFFYNAGIFNSLEAGKPVISIGNLSTGGTGKSPFTIFTAELLISQGFRPAIISRGYRRSSDNIEIVYDGKQLTGNTDKCGDEPVMIAENLLINNKNFYVIAGSDRIKTAQFAIERFNPDVIILDDGFQHRKIRRNLDIVLLDTEELTRNKFYSFFVLPSGNLRESRFGLKRADIIILNKKFSGCVPDYKPEKKSKVFSLEYRIKGFFDKNGNEQKIEKRNVIAFAGIANLGSFFNEIGKLDLNIKNIIRFKDHHNYSESDIMKFRSMASKDDVFITTEKDFVKIKQYKDFMDYFNVLFMKIELNLEGISDYSNLLKEKLPETDK